MKHFAVLSADSRYRGKVLAAAARTFGNCSEWPEPMGFELTALGYRELLVWGHDSEDVLDAGTHQAALLMGLSRLDGDGERLTPRAVLRRVAGSGLEALADVAPPQSFVLAFGDPVEIYAATDHAGISAVYRGERDGTAVASSSARLIAALLGCALDEDAECALAALGEFPATDTPFRGVHRLAGGEYVRVSVDGLRVARYQPPVAPHRLGEDLDGLVKRGVAAVRASVDACLSAYPDASLELSGGLDSRLILASILAAGHQPSECVTLGEPGRPDVVVAGRLASRYGMPHRLVDLQDMSALTPAEALALADTAGRRRDYSGNCVSLGVLDWVEPRAGTQARFSGQNGELARGFYYPFQPASPRTTGALARALVRWRLMANERASGELFTAEATAAGVRRAIQTTVALLERPGGDWLTATDVLYLDWRMQRWVGTDWSAAEQTRPILAPFFHAPYIEWALGAPPRAKRASKLLARVLDGIDPELARLPTAGGSSPHSLFAPRTVDRAERARRTASKVAVKVRQRFAGGSGKPPVGAPLLAQRALEALADERTGLEAVARLPFVSAEYVERVAQQREASPATVGMLVSLRGLVGADPQSLSA